MYLSYRFLSFFSESYIRYLHLNKPQLSQTQVYANITHHLPILPTKSILPSFRSISVNLTGCLSQNLSFILESTLSSTIPPKPISKSHLLYLLNISQIHLLLTISMTTTLTQVKPPSFFTWSTKIVS